MARTFEVEPGVCDYLERLTYTVRGKMNLIDYVLTAHAGDADASVVEGAPFKRLMEGYEAASAEYEAAKAKFAEDNGIASENWKIDFASRTCTAG